MRSIFFRLLYSCDSFRSFLVMFVSVYLLCLSVSVSINVCFPVGAHTRRGTPELNREQGRVKLSQHHLRLVHAETPRSCLRSVVHGPNERCRLVLARRHQQEVVHLQSAGGQTRSSSFSEVKQRLEIGKMTTLFYVIFNSFFFDP